MSTVMELYLFLIVTADEDYFMINTELTFMSGSPLGTNRSTTVVIRDDPRPEGAETFMSQSFTSRAASSKPCGPSWPGNWNKW